MQKFVQGIVAFSLKNSIIVFFLTFLLVVAGVVSYFHTPIEAFPDVTNTRARIITQWSGRSGKVCDASAHEGIEYHSKKV